MDLSVVIVSHNTTSYFRSCLKTLKKNISNKISYEVIVVDNASSENEIKDLKTIKGITVIFLKDNIGFGRANNKGIKQAKGKYILLLNPDTKILNNSIEKLFGFIKTHSYSFIGPQLLNEDKTIQPSCGEFYTLKTVFTLLFLKGEKLGITKYSPTHSRVVDWLSGACLLFKKRDFYKVSQFDENIFLYDEDADLLYRASKMRLSCYFYKDTAIIHTGAVTTKGANSVMNTYVGLTYFYKKHYSYFDQIILKILLLIKFVIATIIFTVQGNKTKLHLYNKAARKTLFTL